MSILDANGSILGCRGKETFQIIKRVHFRLIPMVIVCKKIVSFLGHNNMFQQTLDEIPRGCLSEFLLVVLMNMLSVA